MSEFQYPPKDINEVNEAFLQGDAISDVDLNRLIIFYDRTTRYLDILGPHFHLAWKECHHRLTQLRDFERARKEKY